MISKRRQGLKKYLERKHLKLNNEAFPQNFELCNRDIENATEIKKHLISHSYKCSSQLKYECDECDFWVTNTLTLEMHNRKYHSENITCEFELKDSEIYKSIHLLLKSSNATFVMKF